MADVYLFPQEPNAADVRLREPSAPSTVYTVNVSVTAVATAGLSRTLALRRAATTTAVGTPVVTRRVGLAGSVVATGTTAVTLEVIPAAVTPAPAGGGRWAAAWRPPVAPRRRATWKVHVATTASALPTVDVQVDHAGRRAQEDELLVLV